MAKKKKIESSALDIAEKLFAVRMQKNELIKEDSLLTKLLKEKIKAGEKQEIYKIRTDYPLAVTDRAKAYEFALAHKCVKIDVGLVDDYIKSNYMTIPEGYGIKAKESVVEVTEEREVAVEGIVIEA